MIYEMVTWLKGKVYIFVYFMSWMLDYLMKWLDD